MQDRSVEKRLLEFRTGLALVVGLAAPVVAGLAGGDQDTRGDLGTALCRTCLGHGLPAPGAGAGNATTRPLGCGELGPP